MIASEDATAETANPAVRLKARALVAPPEVCGVSCVAGITEWDRKERMAFVALADVRSADPALAAFAPVRVVWLLHYW